MPAHRFRLVLLAALALFVALVATRSRPTGAGSRRPHGLRDVTPEPDHLLQPPADATAAHRFRTALTTRAHRFQLVLLAALVLFVAFPAGLEQVHSVTAVVVKPPPTATALAGTHEALSKSPRASAQTEPMKSTRPPRSVTPVAVTPTPTASGTRQARSNPAAASPQPERVKSPSPHSGGPLVVKASQKVARLLTTHEAFSKPTRASTLLALVQARRPLTGARTVLPLLDARIGPHGIGWLRVRLPGRPNGGTGWIRQRGTRALTTSWHILVDTSRRRVTVYRSGSRMRIFEGIVGKPSTPTPHGRFFVEEAIALRAFEVGAPYALALSARSNVLQRFNGGPGQIALHGLANVGGIPGTAVSHGCVRLDNDTMRWLVHRIGSGVPVTITS